MLKATSKKSGVKMDRNLKFWSQSRSRGGSAGLSTHNKAREPIRAVERPSC